MPWDSFLMKKLLKSEVCGSVNSAQMYYSRKTWSTTATGKKKKKRERERKRALEKRKRQLSWIQNGQLGSEERMQL